MVSRDYSGPLGVAGKYAKALVSFYSKQGSLGEGLDVKVLVALVLLVPTGCAVPINVDLHKTNIWSTQDSVIITSKMSQLVDIRGELAFVMAHELGHIILLHHGRNSRPDDEMDADRFAFQSMVLAGHDPCFGISAMSKITKVVSSPEFKIRFDHWSKVYPECEVL